MPNPRYVELTRRQAALRQIDAAIKHVYDGEPDLAITLAAAAEGIMPPTDQPHVWKWWKDHPQFEDLNLNETITWLKHYNDQPDLRFIAEPEAAFTIFRAMTKYAAVQNYEGAPTHWITFLEWGSTSGYFPQEESPGSPTGF